VKKFPKACALKKERGRRSIGKGNPSPPPPNPLQKIFSKEIFKWGGESRKVSF